MTPKPQPDEATVDQITDLAVGKCFDWAQGCIAETMAAVAGELAIKAIAIKHELMEDD